jgi:glycosyltransferase involved in cell wall biosynthesis
MPYKNAGPWIEETIQSILNQTFKDWELIAIDDHSTDDSAEIVKRFGSKDHRIHSIANPGTGIISALQAGLNESHGEFITRMDADDIMPESRLALMLENLESAPPKTIVTGKVRYFGEYEVSEGYRKYEKWLNDRILRQDHYDHIYRECVIASPNWITRKNDLIKYSIFENLEYPEDYSMVFLWFEHGFNIVSIDEITLDWREHPQRTSRNSDIYSQASFFELKMNWFRKFNNLEQHSIGIIGAGSKGKLLMSQLPDESAINWYDLNHKNYNTEVMGHSIKNPDDIDDDLLLIAVYPDNPQTIEQFIKEKGYEIGMNAWFV